MILLAFNHSCPVHAPFLRFYLHLRTVCAVLRNGGVSLRKPKKEKNGCSLPKGIEHPFALLYNLIATKNLQESEIIIQQ